MRELLRLDIAGGGLSLQGEPSVRIGNVPSVYLPFMTREAAVPCDRLIRISLETQMLPGIDDMKVIFESGQSWSMRLDAEDFVLEVRPPGLRGPLCAIKFSRDFARVAAYCGEASILSRKDPFEVMNPLGYPVDQVLLMHLFSGMQGAVIHAAGLSMQGRAFLFPGRSGAGKSTISRLLAGQGAADMLSDDRIVVRRSRDILTAYGTPWPGDEGIAGNGSSRLAGVVFIRHGTDNTIDEVLPAEAARLLLPLVSIPWYDEQSMSDVLQFCETIVTELPCYLFTFRPDTTAAAFLGTFLAS